MPAGGDAILHLLQPVPRRRFPFSAALGSYGELPFRRFAVGGPPFHDFVALVGKLHRLVRAHRGVPHGARRFRHVVGNAGLGGLRRAYALPLDRECSKHGSLPLSIQRLDANLGLLCERTACYEGPDRVVVD